MSSSANSRLSAAFTVSFDLKAADCAQTHRKRGQRQRRADTKLLLRLVFLQIIENIMLKMFLFLLATDSDNRNIKQVYLYV